MYFHLRSLATILITVATPSSKLFFLSFFFIKLVCQGKIKAFAIPIICQTFIVWLLCVKCCGKPQGGYSGFSLFCFSGETGLVGETDTYVTAPGQAMTRVIIQHRQSQDSLCKHHSNTEPQTWICHISFLNCTCLTLNFPWWDYKVLSLKGLLSQITICN